MLLKRLFLTITAALTLAITPASLALGTASAAGASACGKSPAAQEVLTNVDQGGKGCGDNRVKDLIGNIVNILSLIAGAASVIVIIYGGFKYMTSGGEQGRIANAKSTVLYALVGLAVAALAQLLVHFVLYQSSKV